MHRPFMVLLLLLAGCSGSKSDLAFTRASDPVWAVNPSQWLGPTQAPPTTSLTQGN